MVEFALPKNSKIPGGKAWPKPAGASRVYWLTQSNNAQARALYDKVADNLGFIQYRKVL